MSVDLLADLNTDTYSAGPNSFVTAGNGAVFFRADDGRHGQELFVTDGTAAGTSLVKDIRPGRASGIIVDAPTYNPTGLVASGDAVYFAADDGVHGLELWRSDGTAGGTRVVRDINPAPGIGGSPRNLAAAADGTVFFVAHDGAAGLQLWKSDGTEPGTVPVKRIGTTTNGANIQRIVPFGNGVAFTANDGVSGTELWVSDGTDAGTRLVQDLVPGAGSSMPDGFTALGQTLFFTAVDPAAAAPNTYALYETDGTAAGTRVVHASPVAGARPSQLTAVGADLYFTLPDAESSQTVIWRYSPAAGRGASRVATGLGVNHLTAFDGGVYFAATTAEHGTELFTADGAGGIRLVADVIPGTASGHPTGLTGAGGSLYFAADRRGTSPVMYRYDAATGATTQAGGPVALSYAPGKPYGSGPVVHAFPGGLLASALGPNIGYELFAVTGDTLTLVKDVGATTLDGQPSNGVEINGRVVFSAVQSAVAGEPFVTDGTPGGTRLLLDLVPGAAAGSNPTGFVRFGDAVYFSAFTPAAGRELWQTDGTPEGTSQVVDLRPGTADAAPARLTVVGDTLYFTADDGGGAGAELWKTDGTAGGTVLVKDVNPGAASSGVSQLVDLNGALLFVADNGTNGREVWRSDGTAGGTSMLLDAYPHAFAAAESLTVAGRYAYFVHNHPTYGRELWRTDGTGAGTVAFDVNPGSASSNPASLTAAGTSLFYTAYTPSLRVALYRASAASAATLVKDIDGSTSAVSPFGAMFGAGNRLFFSGNDGVRGSELWASDGTAAGTAMLAEFAPGYAGGAPNSFFALGGDVYFGANDGAGGFELWQTNGTPAGTRQAAEINPEPYSASFGGGHASPALVALLGGRAILRANDGTHGVEPFVLAPPPPPPNAPPAAAVAGPAAVDENKSGGPSLSAAGSSDSDGWITSYEWDFDYDGSTFAADAEGVEVTLPPLDGPAARAVALRVTDSRGATATAVHRLDVSNVAPALNVSFPPTLVEGKAGTLSGSAADPGADTVTGWTVDWGDGQKATVAGASLSLAHAYADNGTYTITGTATDEDGTYAFAPVTVTVSNAAPVARAGTSGGGSRLEGDVERFAGSFTDAGAADTHSAVWTLRRAGSADVLFTTTQPAFDYAFDDNGTYVATFTVTDDDGAAGSATASVTVGSVAPSGTFDAPAEVAEGGTAALSLSDVRDPSAADRAAGFRYAFDFNGDGAYEVVDLATPAATVPASYFPDGPATRNVRARVTDKDGAAREYVRTINVTNAAPAALITGGPADGRSPEGAAVSYVVDPTDPGPADNAKPFGYAWAVTKDGGPFATGTSRAVEFTPDDDGAYVVTATATDSDGAASAPATRTLAVTNVAPTALFNVNGPVVEGQSVPVRFDAVTDAPADMAEGLRYSFDLNGDGDFTDAGDVLDGPDPVVFHAFRDQGSYALRGRVVDRDGGSNEYAITVNVAHDAPDVTVQGPTTGRRNRANAFRFIATDTGPLDRTFTYLVDWNGDGRVDQTLTGGSVVDVSYTYKNAATYRIGVTARDKDGVSGPTSFFTIRIT